LSPYRSLFVIPPSVRRSLGRSHNRRVFANATASPGVGQHIVPNKAHKPLSISLPRSPPPARRGVKSSAGLQIRRIFLFFFSVARGCTRESTEGFQIQEHLSSGARMDPPEVSLDISLAGRVSWGDHGWEHFLRAPARCLEGGGCAGPSTYTRSVGSCSAVRGVNSVNSETRA